MSSSSIQASASSAVPLPPFRFRSRREAVDWRRIGALDVERVASELDFQTLQEHVAGVTFCSIEAERCQRCQSPIDPGVLKLFRLAQLTVEYLLHSQDYLTASLQAAEDRVQAEQREKEQLHITLQKQADELRALKDELKQRKKIITSQQVMISSGIAGYHKVCTVQYATHAAAWLMLILFHSHTCYQMTQKEAIGSPLEPVFTCSPCKAHNLEADSLAYLCFPVFVQEMEPKA